MKKRDFPPVVSAVCSFAIALLISVNAYAGINEDLLQAIGHNDAGKVRACLGNGADVHTKDQEGNSTLIEAILSGGKVEIVNMLLDKGVNVNAKGMNGNAAIIAASGIGRADLVKILLSRGADVNIASDSGFSALMDAAASGKTDVVKILLGAGALVNAKDGKGYTALSHAASNGYTEPVKVLLANGADVHALSFYGPVIITAASSTLWRHDILRGERSCPFLPLSIAPGIHSYPIITATWRTILRPSSGSMTSISPGNTASGGTIWIRSFTGTSTAVICQTALPA